MLENEKTGQILFEETLSGWIAPPRTVLELFSSSIGLPFHCLKNSLIYRLEKYDKVVELRLEGKSIRVTAEELKVGKDRVHTLIKKGRENGDIVEKE